MVRLLLHARTELSFARGAMGGPRGSLIDESVEEYIRCSCIIAFFLRRSRAGPSTGYSLQRSELAGRLSRLSHEGHITGVWVGKSLSDCGTKPEAAQKSRILESNARLSSNYTQYGQCMVKLIN